MFRPKLVAAVLILCSLCLIQPLSISAQATEEADARAALLQALSTLSQAGGYEFTMNVSQFTTSIDNHRLIAKNAALFSSSGQVDANNNYQDSFTLQSGTNLPTVWDAPIYHVERVKIGDEIDLNLPADLLTVLRWNVAAGWWRAADLSRQLADPVAQRGLVGLINYPSPTRSSINDQTLASVTDVGMETVGNREMHVYDVTLDAAAYLLAQPAGTQLDTYVQYLKAHDLLKDNKSTINDTFWFGSDDNRLYGGRSNVDILLTLPSATGDPQTSSSVEINAAYTLSITYPDQPVVITPPASSLLKH